MTKSPSGIVCESGLQHFHTWIGTAAFSNCLCKGKKPKPAICGKVLAAVRKMQNAKGHTKAFTAEALTALKHILQCSTNSPSQHTPSHKIVCKIFGLQYFERNKVKHPHSQSKQGSCPKVVGRCPTTQAVQAPIATGEHDPAKQMKRHKIGRQAASNDKDGTNSIGY